MKRLAHLASRIFERPLLIEEHRLSVILSVMGPRLGLRPQTQIETDEINVSPPAELSATEGRIAIISIVGPLVKRESGDALSGGPTSYLEIRDAFRAAISDESIKGIMLDVDSPGGEVSGLFSLCEEIFKARTIKPIVAACGDAFSAAYAIASATGRVFVEQDGGVGSVGVIACHVDQSTFDEKLGISYEFLYGGAKKADMNPHEPLSDSARTDLQAEIDRLYQKFVAVVAKHRGVPSEIIRKTEAGLLFDADGVAAGLADEIGGRDEALRHLNLVILSTPAAAAAPQGKDLMHQKDKRLQRAAEELPPADENEDEEEEENEVPSKQEVEGAGSSEEKSSSGSRTPAPMATVIQLCADAGKDAQYAIDLHRRGMTEAEISQHLIRELAQAQAPTLGIRSTVSPPLGRGIHRLDKLATEEARRTGRTEAQAFRDLLVQHPEAYEEYLRDTASQRAAVER